MDVINLFNERETLTKSLSDSYSHLWTKGREHALAEYEYKKALSVECYRLHEVDKIGWSSCQPIAHGRDTVADLRRDRDLARVEYEVMNEKIQGIKLQLRLIEAQLQRDWSVSK